MLQNANNIGQNLSLLTDFYEFTMLNGYFKTKYKDTYAYFDVFFRNIPDNGGFAIMAGLEQMVEYLENLSFSEEDIAFLKGTNKFCDEFLEYLKNFKFTCDVWSVPEGTPIFPHEPIITIAGPILQAQFIETMILLCINHQSLIATKASRIVRATEGRQVIEFGARRAQGFSAAVYGARAAFIGGCSGTSCTLADKLFNIPCTGTMAHSWVQMFESEYEAFKTYANIYPDGCSLLVDTYNVIKSGVPNAIKVFKEANITNGSIRIDSGDIAYLSQKSRKMLDENGLFGIKICASNSLDEYIIRDMIRQNSQVDIFGVGERLITSASNPVFGGVYKLVAIKDNLGNIIPKIKVSENIAKITNPGFKCLWRLYSNNTGKALADVITMHDENIESDKPYEIFDPVNTWKKKTITNFKAVKLVKQIFKNGKRCIDLPNINQIQNYCNEQLSTLWPEIKRFENPHSYYVDLSARLWNIKKDMINDNLKLK